MRCARELSFIPRASSFDPYNILQAIVLVSMMLEACVLKAFFNSIKTSCAKTTIKFQ